MGLIGFISYYWIYVYLIMEYLKLFIHKRTSFLDNVLFIVFIVRCPHRPKAVQTQLIVLPVPVHPLRSHRDSHVLRKKEISD